MLHKAYSYTLLALMATNGQTCIVNGPNQGTQPRKPLNNTENECAPQPRTSVRGGERKSEKAKPRKLEASLDCRYYVSGIPE